MADNDSDQTNPSVEVALTKIESVKETLEKHEEACAQNYITVRNYVIGIIATIIGATWFLATEMSKINTVDLKVETVQGQVEKNSVLLENQELSIEHIEDAQATMQQAVATLGQKLDILVARSAPSQTTIEN